MKPIRIIDKDFILLSEIDDYESLIWARKWHRPGEFELHININKQNTHTLQKENIVLFGDKAGVIRHREIVIDESGKGGETLLIKGSSLSSLVGRRITLPPIGNAYDAVNGNAETVLKHYVDVNCVNPADANRKIPNLIIAPNSNRGINLKYQSRLKQLNEELEKISMISGLGWDISIDIENKKFVFDVMEGNDLTTNQTENNPVIFSIDFDNIKGQTYIDSDLNYRNQAYVGGQGEGVDRSIVEIGNNLQGLDRHEVFIDARDIENELDLPTRGQQKLLEMARLQSFESEILNKGTFEYEKDWNLGDIVTVVNPKWGITMETRVIEVREIYEPSGFKLEAAFGNTIPTLIDKIKKEIDMPLIENKTKLSQLENDGGYIKSEEVVNIVDGIEIGGRNYLVNSSLKTNSGPFKPNQNVTLSNPNGEYLKVYSNQSSSTPGIIIRNFAIEDAEYTVSFDVRGFGGVKTVGVCLLGLVKEVNVTEEFQRKFVTLRPSFTQDWFLIYWSNKAVGEGFEIKNIKLEKGNKPTDWTPALEDIVLRIEAIEQQLGI